MSPRNAVALLLLVLASCDAPQEVGIRYRAERDLYQVHREARRLSIQPRLVGPEDWQAIASRFERIADEYGTVAAAHDSSAAGRTASEVREIAAQSLITAAEVRAMVGDSLRMMEDYERVASQFQDLPQMTAEVALAQGRIAESRGEVEQAIGAYESFVDRITPNPEAVGVAAVIVELPLRIARLQARSVGGSLEASRGFYEKARARYERFKATQPGTLVEVDAQQHLADIAADLGEWTQAIEALRLLEARLVAVNFAGRDPATARFGIALVQARSDATGTKSRETLQSLLKDYPKSPIAPQALIVLATESARRGSVDEALAYLDRIREEYPDAQSVLEQSLLVRGRLLEQSGRWPEALETFRSLPVEHPISEAALQAPLEIIGHYQQTKDAQAAAAELSKAESYYRDFLTRYPPGPYTVSARTRLVQILAEQRRFDDAIAELTDMGESMRPSPQGAACMVEAARIAMNELDDRTRAMQLLERTGSLYPNTAIGRWAATEAVRMRDGADP